MRAEPNDGPALSDDELLSGLLDIRQTALQAVADRAESIDELEPSRRLSAVNLLHYLAVRRFDLTELQLALARRGLSSLGRSEAHALASVDLVVARLIADLGGGDLPAASPAGPTVAQGRAVLDGNAIEALGQAPKAHTSRVMVTLPSEAAHDPALVDGFVAARMDIARINGAHDHVDAWQAMASNVRAAAGNHGRDVLVAFDLPGPKLRTGEIEPCPAVLKVRPERDRMGRVTQPAQVRFAAAPGCGRGLPVVPVDGVEFFESVEPGDRVELVDTRGRARALLVVAIDDDGFVATTDRTIYFTPGQELQRRAHGGPIHAGTVGSMADEPGELVVEVGDVIEIHRGEGVGRPARLHPDGTVAEPAMISVDVDELYTALEVGERILFDDGTIEAKVIGTDGVGMLRVEVTRTSRTKLRGGKGINLPDVELPTPGLTDADVALLEQVAPFIDLVAMSFVGGPEDIVRLHDHLDRLGVQRMGVIAKIERRRAFAELPEILLAMLRRMPAAVMVARGDLAVELGYERMAEVQEEILWLAEAAHIPVIWATQVLETLAKVGAPTRAEVTDAAWSGRAECVMLNKGPYMADTIRFLVDVLTRMQEHRSKRTPVLRRLAVAGSAAGGKPE